jgi:hypothetical protein
MSLKSVQWIRVVSCGRTDEQTDMTKLIVAFRNFANARKNYDLFLSSFICVLRIILTVRRAYILNIIDQFLCITDAECTVCETEM